MSGNFKVGEVLVGVGFLDNPECNGLECVVTEGISWTEVHQWADGKNLGVQPVYGVRWADGCNCYVAPHNLRRKQPPSGELSILNMFVVAPPQRTKEIA